MVTYSNLTGLSFQKLNVYVYHFATRVMKNIWIKGVMYILYNIRIFPSFENDIQDFIISASFQDILFVFYNVAVSCGNPLYSYIIY